MDETARRRALGLGSVVAVAGLAVFLVGHGPYVDGVSCPSRALSGLDRPRCGSTRCLAALLDGDVVAAVDQNLLAVAVLPLVLWAWGSWLVSTWTGRRSPTPLDRTGAALATLVAVAGFVVVRNVDLGVGAFLASGAT